MKTYRSQEKQTKRSFPPSHCFRQGGNWVISSAFPSSPSVCGRIVRGLVLFELHVSKKVWDNFPEQDPVVLQLLEHPSPALPTSLGHPFYMLQFDSPSLVCAEDEIRTLLIRFLSLGLAGSLCLLSSALWALPGWLWHGQLRATERVLPSQRRQSHSLCVPVGVSFGVVSFSFHESHSFTSRQALYWDKKHGMEGYAAPMWSPDSAADERPQRKHLI